MREMHREPEVPDARVPVVECLDGPARITSKELAPIHSMKKWHPPECLFHKTKSGCRFGEKCSYAHCQVDKQPSKKSKKNDDKNAVAMLKKYDLHDRTWQPVINRDESQDRSGQPVVKRDTRHELKHGPVRCGLSNTRQLGCVFQDMEPPKSSSILRKSSDMQKPIQRVNFTSYCTSH